MYSTTPSRESLRISGMVDPSQNTMSDISPTLEISDESNEEIQRLAIEFSFFFYFYLRKHKAVIYLN